MKKFFDKIYKESFNEFIEEIKRDVISNNKKFIVTANPETFMIAEKDKDFHYY